MESKTVTVENGFAEGTFSSLSPFAVVKVVDDPVITENTTITGLPENHELVVNEMVSWAPDPANGEWSYDTELLEIIQNGDTYTFKALKDGKATATYTINGVPHTVTIIINSSTIPLTGDTMLNWMLVMMVSLLSYIGLLSYRKLNYNKHLG